MGHHHTLWRIVPGPPSNGRPRRGSLTDRCNSQLLWATVSVAVLKDADPYMDGKSLTKWTKEQAWAYLLTCHSQWRRNLQDPTIKET